MLVCRRLQQKKEKSVDKKRQRVEERHGGFARLQGSTYKTSFIVITFYIIDGLTVQIGWFGLRVGGHPALSLQSAFIK